MAQPPYALLKSHQPDPIQCHLEGRQAVETLREELSKAPTLGHPDYDLPLFLLSVKIEEMLQNSKTWSSSQSYRMLYPVIRLCRHRVLSVEGHLCYSHAM